MKPLCFVIMPFGIKTDKNNKMIDFNNIYENLIHPAIENVGLEPIRADEERAGGMIHKPMYERLIMCDYAVADLTTANANVFYELGVRHAVRPYKTALIFSNRTQLPFDVSMLRAIPYKLDDNGKLTDKTKDLEVFTKKLIQLKEDTFTDSPLFQLFDELHPQELSHQKTDIFRERVEYSQGLKEQLKEGRKKGLYAVKAIEGQLEDIQNVESGILIDLFLSYRAVKGWCEMIDLATKLPAPLKNRLMVREQMAFALHRNNQSDKSEEILLEAIDQHGPSSETYGLLGRIYKDLWEKSREAGEKVKARAYLNKAINTYINGFEADWRDFFPGINAVTLLDINDPDDLRKKELLPVVEFAVKQKMARGKADYWDHATCLELAILSDDRTDAEKSLENCITAIREPWEPETTARNLRLIAHAREEKGKDSSWITEIINQLLE